MTTTPREKRRAWYANAFPGRYYLEVQAHNSPGQRELNEQVFRLAAELGLPVIATNDAHFLRREDHDSHDVLLCIGLGKDRADADRMRYDRELYFKNATEIAAHFPDHPEVLSHTLEIADRVDIPFSKTYRVPSFPLPTGVVSENALLVQLATEGAKARYGDPLPETARERLEYELGVITKTGYAGYFLIVADFIRAARDQGIPVGPGRGSAAGSLVAYALRITNICPLKFGLLFERFLNPERISMPDIDVDFCFERRGEVIEYVRQKYGRDSVGQIVTFGTLKSRAVIKDVGRTLGFTPAETDALAKLVPNQPNYSLTIREATEQISEIRRLYEGDERYRQLLDYAMALEGLARHSGVHAAGVVIAPGPLDDYVPGLHDDDEGRQAIARRGTAIAGSAAGASHATPATERADDETVVVTQYDMNALEKAGLLKMDFLGLTTLTVLSDAVASIHTRAGTVIDLDALPLDDEATYRMLRSGRTGGVFQFESPLATDLLRSMRCDRFDDLVASNALMRPGPLDTGMHRVFVRRKRGEEPVSYPLPGARADPREHAGRDHVPGTGDAHRPGPGRHFARRSRRPAQSGRQEGSRADSPGARQVRREGRRPGVSAPSHYGHCGADRDLRALWLQPLAQCRVLDPLVPDGVAQNALSCRLHGRTALVADRRYRCGRQIHQ